jgi:hypothetical protein
MFYPVGKGIIRWAEVGGLVTNTRGVSVSMSVVK